VSPHNWTGKAGLSPQFVSLPVRRNLKYGRTKHTISNEWLSSPEICHSHTPQRASWLSSHGFVIVADACLNSSPGQPTAIVGMTDSNVLVPNYWALVIGINYYRTEKCLKGSVRDANIVQHFLQSEDNTARIFKLTATAPSDETLQEIGDHAAAVVEAFIALLWRVYHHHQENKHFPKYCAASLATEWEAVKQSAGQVAHEKGLARRVRHFSTLLKDLQDAEELYNEHVV
jgi:hypothetical protein